MKLHLAIQICVLFVVACCGTVLHWTVIVGGRPEWDDADSKNIDLREVPQTFVGVVLSMKDNRFNHTKGVLAALNITATQKVPPPYYSATVDMALETHTGGRAYHNNPKFLKVLSNRMAFVDAIGEFAAANDSNHVAWRFFFEDDIALHPSLSAEDAKRALVRGLALAARDGIVYLGICGPICDGAKALGGVPGVHAARCAGACAHAFGFQRWKAAEFLAKMGTLAMEGPDPIDTGLYFDRYLYAFTRMVHKIWVIGSNLRSPVESVSDHYGLLYQDRSLFHSEISQ